MYTANNNSLRGSLLPLFYLFLSALFIHRVEAQKISKYYTVMSQKSGSLYFIEPERSFKNKENKCELVYDMTYLSSEDSLTFNFSLISPEIIEIDSLVFLSQGEKYTSPASKLYIEDEKKSWEHRYSTRFKVDEIDSIYQQEKSPALKIFSNRETLILNMKQNHWEKESNIVTKILYMIAVN
jgi:hypothetical protein